MMPAVFSRPAQITTATSRPTRTTRAATKTSRTEALGAAQERTITTAWLSNFNLPSSITEPGRVTNFSYDANGNLLGKTIVAGSQTRSWAYTYNAFGQALTATDPRGSVTAYTYDTAGNLASITDPLGHVTRFDLYDGAGRLLSMTDPNGLTTSWTYNFRGQPITRTVGNAVTAYEYDLAGQLVKIARPNGSYFVLTYDAAHRLTGIKDALGNRIAYSYDTASNITAVQVFDAANTLARTRSYIYGVANRVAQAIGAQGQTTAYAYDPQGNLTGITDPLGHARAYAYDALNRLIQAVDPQGGLTDYDFDVLNRLTAVTDPRGLTTAYTWDGLDNQTAVASPDSGTTARTFDAAGNVATSTDARGLTTSYQYDPLNRRVKATYADGKSIAWGYDQGPYGIGHLTSMIDPSGHTKWAYNSHRHLAGESRTIGGRTLTTRRHYAAGRLVSLIYPSGATIDFSYDAAAQVSSLSLGGVPLLSNITHSPFGPPVSWTQGNGGVYSRSLDLDGRIAGIALGNGSTMTLAYDTASRITGIATTGLPNKSFAYDVLDRLTGYTSGATALTYGYDANSNRVSLNANGTAIAYGIDPNSNRLLSSTGAGTRSLAYDAAGNVTADNQPLVNLGYTYNASGRLVTAKTGAYTTSYTNDGLGERATRSGYGASLLLAVPAIKAEGFVYDPAGHLLGEYQPNSTVIQETVWLGDLPVATLMPGQGPYYIAPDHLGAPHQILDGARSAVWRWDHDPFGQGKPSGQLTYNLRFPGQYYNAETGLHYNGFRDYDPSTGRYVQSDPIGLEGGINTYAYVGGNPVGNIDPDGLRCTSGQGCWTTIDERLALLSGGPVAYYRQACANGDSYTCFAQHIAANDNFAGRIANDRLLDYMNTYATQSGQCLNASSITAAIRNELAERYANYLPASPNQARWPSAQDIAQFHWDVFAKYGLPPETFGGTPFGSRVGTIGSKYFWPFWCPECK